MEMQPQEQNRFLEIAHQQRIEVENGLQLLNQQDVEVDLLESAHTEVAIAAARLQQTLEQCQHSYERKQALDRELQNMAHRLFAQVYFLV